MLGDFRKAAARAPRRQPLVDVTATRYRRQIIDILEQIELRQGLQNAKVETGAANTAAGKAKSYQPGLRGSLICVGCRCRGWHFGLNSQLLPPLRHLLEFAVQEPQAGRISSNRGQLCLNVRSEE